MPGTILQLEVGTTSNEGIFLIKDTSIYYTGQTTPCINLQVTPPGFGSPVLITPSSTRFDLVLNACTLGIIGPTNCAIKCPGIPDGIYGIRYSIADNIFVEYQYMRITKAMNRLNGLLYALGLPSCLPGQELEYDTRNIDMIRNYLLSAQTNVNEQSNYQDAINQYRYALDLMDKMARTKPNCVNY